jgi:hypothetical protein
MLFSSSIIFNLPKCQAEPTPLECRYLQQAVWADLHAIPHPTFGVGAWLGTVMEATEYRELNGFDWVEPQLPKKPTRTFFSFLTGAAAQAQQEYRQDLAIYTQYRKIVRELRTQLLKAADKAYLEY